MDGYTRKRFFVYILYITDIDIGDREGKIRNVLEVHVCKWQNPRIFHYPIDSLGRQFVWLRGAGRMWMIFLDSYWKWNDEELKGGRRKRFEIFWNEMKWKWNGWKKKEDQVKGGRGESCQLSLIVHVDSATSASDEVSRSRGGASGKSSPATWKATFRVRFSSYFKILFYFLSPCWLFEKPKYKSFYFLGG